MITTDAITELTTDTAGDSSSVRDEPRNPLIGMVGFMSVFAAFGATYVGITRHDPAVVTQLGITATICAVICAVIAKPERHPR